MGYSQASQDVFVDLVLNHPQQGYFVDVGAGCDDPKTESNSLLFEERGWKGIAIDMNSDRLRGRTCKTVTAMIGDGTNGTSSLASILDQHQVPKEIDYLSIDLEGLDLKAVVSFVESGYRFKVLTIEHNLYSMNPGVDVLKRDIFLFLSNHNYVRVGDNIGSRATIEDFHRGWAFEDWYIDPSQVSYSRAIKIMRGEL